MDKISAPDLMSVKRFCEGHTMSHATFYKLVSSGKAPALTRVGRRVYISQESAAAWRAANTLPPGQSHHGGGRAA